MPRSGDMNCGALNSAANSSGPSIGASSLVTDANSPLSGGTTGPRLQRSTSNNTEAYSRLPASPMSFNSAVDGSSVVQQEEAQRKRAGSSATSQPTAWDNGYPLHVQKRARIDMGQGAVLQPQVIQQLIHGHQNSQLQAALQQQRLMHDSARNMMPGLIQMQQPVRRSLEGGILHQQVLKYMYHLRNHRPDNSISYWRNFVANYYAPRAKHRWCLSTYNNDGNHGFGAFPQTSLDAWNCDLCNSKPAKGFEATFEVLPRLNQINFDRGVTDELLFLELPCERQLPSGILILEYAKAVQESVYEQLRVVREGKLQIYFSPDLKILKWEFCMRSHEEFVSRRSPQVNQLLEVARKYQTAVTESGSSGISHQDLQSSCNMFVTASRQLARHWDLQFLNDLGFSKRFMRCLQVSEVVNSMKDLMQFSQEQKMGPIESLRSYPRQAPAAIQTEKMHEEHLTADQSNLSKVMAFHPGMSSNINNYHVAGTRVINHASPSAIALNNYQNFLRSSVALNPRRLQPDAPYSFNNPNQALSMQFQGSVSSINQALPMQSQGPVSSILMNNSVNGLSSLQQQQQQQQQKIINGCLPQQNNLRSSSNAVQQMLQEAINNSKSLPQQPLNKPPSVTDPASANMLSAGGLLVQMNSGSMRNGIGMANVSGNVSNHATEPALSQSNSFKSVSDCPTAISDTHNDMILPEVDHNMSHDFVEDIMQW